MPMSTLGGVCLLGLDFLKKYKGIINLVENSLSLELGEKKVVVPLIEGHVFILILMFITRISKLLVNYKK